MFRAATAGAGVEAWTGSAFARASGGLGGEGSGGAAAALGSSVVARAARLVDGTIFLGSSNSGFWPTSSIDPPAPRKASSRSSAACFITVRS